MMMAVSTYKQPKRIGEILLHQGWVKSEDLTAALEQQKAEILKRPIGQILIDKGAISKNILYRALAIQFGKQFVDLTQMKIHLDAIRITPKRFVEKQECMPIRVQEGILLVAVSDPMQLSSLSQLEHIPGVEDIEVVVASREDIDETIKIYYGTLKESLNARIALQMKKIWRYFFVGETINF